MKHYLLSASLVMSLVLLFSACENSNPMQNESSGEVFSAAQIVTLNTYDAKRYDAIDDWLIASWVFPANPDDNMELQNDLLISIGMEEGSVDESIEITAELYWSWHNGCAFEFGPHGTEFLQPIQVSTALFFWDVPGGVEFDELSYFHVDDMGTPNPNDDLYYQIPSYIEDYSLVGHFEHFSKYAVGVLPSSN